MFFVCLVIEDELTFTVSDDLSVVYSSFIFCLLVFLVGLLFCCKTCAIEICLLKTTYLLTYLLTYLPTYLSAYHTQVYCGERLIPKVELVQ